MFSKQIFGYSSALLCSCACLTVLQRRRTSGTCRFYQRVTGCHLRLDLRHLNDVSLSQLIKRPFRGFVLKQQRLFLVDAFEYLSDRNANFVAVITNVSLKRFAPATVEQRSDSGHARCWRCILGASDASQDLDAHLGVSTRQRA